MDFQQFSKKGMVKFFKIANFKKHIIHNIEIIGQRKLAILGNEEDNKLLLDAISSLKNKNVKVPDIAFFVTIDQRVSKKNSEIKFISDIKGMNKSIYVLITTPYTDFEKELANRWGLLSDAPKNAQSLKNIGFSEDDFCMLNKPFALYSMCNAFYKLVYDFQLNARKSKSISMAKKTHEKLLTYKDKHKDKRVFLVGYRGIKLDQYNKIMNERTISYNEIYDIFPKTPQRPMYYLLSEQNHYLGNGKHIEGLECFITSDVNVFEEKFAKQPVYLDVFTDNLIEDLPSFDVVRQNYTLKKIDDLYYMLQMSIFMGFNEIYICGFDELYSAYINELEEAHLGEDFSIYAFPEQAQAILKTVDSYAKEHGIKIYSLCSKELLDVFEHKDWDEIEFNKTIIL